MSDLMTVGACASLILSMGAEAALKSGVGEAIKDAYKSLKNRLGHSVSGDVAALEQNPGSAARRAVIAETIDRLPDSEKPTIKALADNLADRLEKASAVDPIGVDLGRLKAARIQLQKITVTDGVGFRAQEVETTGDFDLKDLNVGRTPGKLGQ